MLARAALIALTLLLASAAPVLAQGGSHGGHGAQTASGGADMLASSTPQDGAVLSVAPRTLSLAFAHPVILQTVAITGPQGAPVRATFRRPQTATTSYAVALPALIAGSYQVQWNATGGGHQMSGMLRFTVR